MKCSQVLVPLLCLAFAASASPSRAAPPGAVRNVLLVHGAFADGSSWSRVIPLLEKEGLNVVSVQNPMLGLVEDAASVRRALAALSGSTLLVGHSLAGVVVTEVGADPKVVGLVYVSSPPLDVGENLAGAGKGFPTPPGQAEIVPEADGFVFLTRAGIEQHFAFDLPMAERRLLWAVQGDCAGHFFEDRQTVAAWKTRPSWSVIGKHDHMLDPGMLEKRARDAGAKVTLVDSSHVVLVSHPAVVARVILEAARESGKRVGAVSTTER